MDIDSIDIAAARRSLGLSQSQLAQVMGLARGSVISRYETGERTPDPPTRRLMRAYLDGYRPPDWPD